MCSIDPHKWHLCGWVELIPRRTRQNEGLGTGLGARLPGTWNPRPSCAAARGALPACSCAYAHGKLHPRLNNNRCGVLCYSARKHTGTTPWPSSRFDCGRFAAQSGSRCELFDAARGRERAVGLNDREAARRVDTTHALFFFLPVPMITSSTDKCGVLGPHSAQCACNMPSLRAYG